MESAANTFRETALWSTPIRDLGLSIKGSRLEPIVEEFRAELARAGIARLTPQFYLSTEWGVAFGTIAIAIPFYLARPELIAVHAERAGPLEGAGRGDLLRYLRHEMGHVVNYAYKLYDHEDWVRLFGSMTRPYVEDYRPEPFSMRFVRHLPGWYAQKHPDEDWAETFAVWMTPGLDWRAAYADWPEALAKLQYCETVMASCNSRDPDVTDTEPDEEVGALGYSLEHYYSDLDVSETEALPPGLDSALKAIFEDLGDPETSSTAPRKSAAELIRRWELPLVSNVYRWTGHFPERTRPLVQHLARRAAELEQVYPADRETDVVLGLTTLVTALAANHVLRGSYMS
jgi:hypothetical protein